MKTYETSDREFYLLVNNLEDQQNVGELRVLVADTVAQHLKAYAQGALDYLEDVSFAK